MDLSKLDKIRVNFIVGSGRSGTTLLVYVFNQHPNCIASPEVKHLMFFYKKYKNIEYVTEQLLIDYRNYLTLFKKNKKFLLASENTTSYLDDLVLGQPITYAQLTKLLYLCLVERKSDLNTINCIIDKNPYYTFYVEHILELFPDAKILFMVRDPRAFVLSNRQSQKPFVKVLSLSYYALVWNLFAENIYKKHQQFKRSTKIVRYEDLAANKELVVEEISKFFGVDYSDQMFDFYKTVQSELEEKKMPIHLYKRAQKKLLDLSSPINMNRVNAWKEQMSSHDIKKIDFLCRSYITLLGYEIIYTATFLEKIIYMLTSLFAHIRIALFKLTDSPFLNYLIYINQIKRKGIYLNAKGLE